MESTRSGRSLVVVLVLLCGMAVAAQTPGAPTEQESSALAEGWAMLARGATAEAAGHAALLLGRFPDSPSVLALSIEAEIARAGATAALAQYESWLAARSMEEPAIVRRIAHAVLRETAAAGTNGTAAVEALRALAAGGDAHALSELRSQASAGSQAETRVLASIGDEQAVRELAGSLGAGNSNPLETIRVLGESNSPVALPALLEQARSPEPAIRQAAVTALAGVGGEEATEAIRNALRDPVGMVRGQAAGALYRLGDDSGVELIRELAASDHPMAQLAAAQHLSARPDDEWRSLVRGLAGQGQPSDVRLAAARLLVPEAPEEAEQIFRELAADPAVDLAVREDATRSQPMATAMSGDLTTLRGHLRSPDSQMRVAAAAHILSTTRR